jgi:hypothetical protein
MNDLTPPPTPPTGQRDSNLSLTPIHSLPRLPLTDSPTSLAILHQALVRPRRSDSDATLVEGEGGGGDEQNKGVLILASSTQDGAVHVTVQVKVSNSGTPESEGEIRRRAGQGFVGEKGEQAEQDKVDNDLLVTEVSRICLL